MAGISSCGGIQHFTGVSKSRRAAANREFSQIGNVDVGVNVDIQSHPVGHHTPQILRLVSYFKKKIHTDYKFQRKITANISGKEKIRYLLLWTSFFCGVVDPTG